MNGGKMKEIRLNRKGKKVQAQVQALNMQMG